MIRHGGIKIGLSDATVTRALLIPAAGPGTRLGSSLPKLLTPVAGRAMIDHVLDRYWGSVEAAVVVVHPASRSMVAEHLCGRSPVVFLAEQPAPTGMLDAILAARDAVLRCHPDRIWITWCDQVGISATTVATLKALEMASPDLDVIMPVVTQPSPYVHFDRDPEGRLIAVRHRREGDPMPEIGRSDAGLFSLSRAAFDRRLPEFARSAAPGALTGERNFLPFLPWLAVGPGVRTFEISAEEAEGINTPEELAAADRRLRSEPRAS